MGEPQVVAVVNVVNTNISEARAIRHAHEQSHIRACLSYSCQKGHLQTRPELTFNDDVFLRRIPRKHHSRDSD